MVKSDIFLSIASKSKASRRMSERKESSSVLCFYERENGRVSNLNLVFVFYFCTCLPSRVSPGRVWGIRPGRSSRSPTGPFSVAPAGKLQNKRYKSRLGNEVNNAKCYFSHLVLVAAALWPASACSSSRCWAGSAGRTYNKIQIINLIVFHLYKGNPTTCPCRRWCLVWSAGRIPPRTRRVRSRWWARPGRSCPCSSPRGQSPQTSRRPSAWRWTLWSAGKIF